MTTDFDGHGGNTIKYGVFTLACSVLLAHLDPLAEATRNQTRLTQYDIWDDLAAVLGDIYAGNPGDLAEASVLLLDGLRFKRSGRATVSAAVAEVMDDIIDQIEANATGWDYRTGVERWQTAGRDLARRFYADSPHPVTQQRLGRDATLAFEWVSEARQAPFGYRQDRQAAAESLPAGVITVRFSFQDRFANYLTYPFYFMHEYVSHVYAVETGSEFFADGWLLYAAYAFLKQLDERARLLPLHGRQIDAYERYILRYLTRGRAWDGYYMAKKCRGRVERHRPGCFQTLMHDLAALSPTAGLRHADFLHRLARHRETNWDNLQRWLESAACRVEAVWSWL